MMDGQPPLHTRVIGSIIPQNQHTAAPLRPPPAPPHRCRHAVLTKLHRLAPPLQRRDFDVRACVCTHTHNRTPLFMRMWSECNVRSHLHSRTQARTAASPLTSISMSMYQKIKRNETAAAPPSPSPAASRPPAVSPWGCKSLGRPTGKD